MPEICFCADLKLDWKEYQKRALRRWNAEVVAINKNPQSKSNNLAETQLQALESYRKTYKDTDPDLFFLATNFCSRWPHWVDSPIIGYQSIKKIISYLHHADFILDYFQEQPINWKTFINTHKINIKTCHNHPDIISTS